MPPWKSNLPANRDARKHPRFPAQGPVRILWQDESGRERMGRGMIVNVSVAGLCLRMPERVPVRAALICNEQSLGISGRGVVRYCNYVKGQYEIGVEFGNGTGWKEPPPESSM